MFSFMKNRKKYINDNHNSFCFLYKTCVIAKYQGIMKVEHYLFDKMKVNKLL